MRELRSIPLTELKILTRSKNALANENIRTVGDVLDYDRPLTMFLVGFSHTGLRMLKDELRRCGVSEDRVRELR